MKNGIKGNVQVISADCGAGKTRWIINKVCKQEGLHLIAQPTNKLIEQTYQSIKDISTGGIISKPLNVLKITSENSCNVVDKITKELSNTAENHKIILITHKALQMINEFDKWDIHIDEALNVVNVVDLNINDDNREVVNNCVTFKSSKEMVAEIAINLDVEMDDINGTLIEKLKEVVQYDHYNANNDFFDKKVNKLTFTCMNQPDRFFTSKSVTVYGNAIEETLMYKVWNDSVIWKHVAIHGLSQRKTPLSERVKIHYFTDEVFTRYWIDSGSSPLNKAVEHINGLAKDFLWTCNVKDQSKLKFNELGTFISPASHGSNSYSHFTDVIWCASMKPSPNEIAMLKSNFAVDVESIIRSREYEMLYQVVARTNIRDYESDKAVNVYVMDKLQAQHLCDVCNVSFSDVVFIDVGAIKKLVGAPYKTNKKSQAYKDFKNRNKDKSIAEKRIAWFKWRAKQLDKGNEVFDEWLNDLLGLE